MDGLSPEEISAKSATIEAKRDEKMATPEGRADMQVRIAAMFNEMDVEKKGSISHDEFKYTE